MVVRGFVRRRCAGIGQPRVGGCDDPTVRRGGLSMVVGNVVAHCEQGRRHGCATSSLPGEPSKSAQGRRGVWTVVGDGGHGSSSRASGVCSYIGGIGHRVDVVIPGALCPDASRGRAQRLGGIVGQDRPGPRGSRNPHDGSSGADSSHRRQVDRSADGRLDVIGGVGDSVDHLGDLIGPLKRLDLGVVCCRDRFGDEATHEPHASHCWQDDHLGLRGDPRSARGELHIPGTGLTCSNVDPFAGDEAGLVVDGQGHQITTMVLSALMVTDPNSQDLSDPGPTNDALTA